MWSYTNSIQDSYAMVCKHSAESLDSLKKKGISWLYGKLPTAKMLYKKMLGWFLFTYQKRAGSVPTNVALPVTSSARVFAFPLMM